MLANLLLRFYRYLPLSNMSCHFDWKQFKKLQLLPCAVLRLGLHVVKVGESLGEPVIYFRITNFK